MKTAVKSSAKLLLVGILVFSCIVGLCACGADSEFVGTWQGTTGKGESCSLVIESNGSYLLQVTGYTASVGTWEEIGGYYMLKYEGSFGASSMQCTLGSDGVLRMVAENFTWKSAEFQKN